MQLATLLNGEHNDHLGSLICLQRFTKIASPHLGICDLNMSLKFLSKTEYLQNKTVWFIQQLTFSAQQYISTFCFFLYENNACVILVPFLYFVEVFFQLHHIPQRRVILEPCVFSMPKQFLLVIYKSKIATFSQGVFFAQKLVVQGLINNITAHVASLLELEELDIWDMRHLLAARKQHCAICEKDSTNK